MSKPLPPSRTAPQFVVRFPDDEMRDRIKAAADANNRSMNAEIIARLQESLEGKEVVGPDGKRILSAIQRLEGLLAATEAQLAIANHRTLIISNALTTAYPFLTSLMEQSPESRNLLERPLRMGVSLIKDFVNNHQPQGFDHLAGLESTAKLMFPNMRRDAPAVEDITDASNKVKAVEERTIQRIKDVVDSIDTPPYLA